MNSRIRVQTRSVAGVLAMGMLLFMFVGVDHRLHQVEAGGAVGDASCDGTVNSIDAALILQFNAGFIALDCSENADVNDDGRIDSIDASLVLQLVAGLIDSLVRDTPVPATPVPCDVSVGPSTVQETVDQAAAGTTICLTAGSYSEIRLISKSGLKIVGAGSATVVTDSGDSDGCVFVFESQNIEVSDLSTSNCVARGAFAASSDDVVFRRLEIRGGPVGFHYVRSSGKILDSSASDHHRANPPGIGVLLNGSSTVTVEDSEISDTDIGILARDDSTLTVKDSDVSDNEGVGINNMVARDSVERTGTTSIQGTTILRNGLGVFVGVPGCAPLPPADPAAPDCYVAAPDDFVSDLSIEIMHSTIADSEKTGVVIFPGGRATIVGSEISRNGLTGLFAWGATVVARDNEYGDNVENAIECRAYPDPATGDRGMCVFTDEHIHDSMPLPGNVLGGGFVSEGADFRLRSSLIEDNWGIGVSVHHNGKGEVIGNTVRRNGGTAFCFSEFTWLERRDNITAQNRDGDCRGHP